MVWKPVQVREKRKCLNSGIGDKDIDGILRLPYILNVLSVV